MIQNIEMKYLPLFIALIVATTQTNLAQAQEALSSASAAPPLQRLGYDTSILMMCGDFGRYSKLTAKFDQSLAFQAGKALAIREVVRPTAEQCDVATAAGMSALRSLDND